jgi:hypothetical protein
MAAVWLVFAAQEFRFLPNPVDVGFVGTGSALGGVALGFLAYSRVATPDEIAAEAAMGAMAFGIVACIIWLAGLAGLRFE